VAHRAILHPLAGYPTPRPTQACAYSSEEGAEEFVAAGRFIVIDLVPLGVANDGTVACIGYWDSAHPRQQTLNGVGTALCARNTGPRFELNKWSAGVTTGAADNATVEYSPAARPGWDFCTFPDLDGFLALSAPELTRCSAIGAATECMLRTLTVLRRCAAAVI
jgi:hypothetical protein